MLHAHRIVALSLLVVSSFGLSLYPSQGGPAQAADIDVNTFSIVAYDPVAKEWGCGVASKVIAVGSIVPWAKTGVGAVATQAQSNRDFGPDGLSLLAKSMSAHEVLAKLKESDPNIEVRQVGVIDAKGSAVAFTGAKCISWAGHKVGKNYACQGNLLAGEAVINEMAKAFEEAKGTLPWKLMAALEAGDKAGGDKRGKQSAAILVVGDKTGGRGGVADRYIDLRVDEHTEPVSELARILAMKLKRPK